MKRNHRTRIGLNRETLRHLGDDVLVAVVGGMKNQTVPTDCCRTSGCGGDTFTISAAGTGCTTSG